MNTVTIKNQQTLLGDDYILIWIEAFLKAKKAENLSKGTIKFYRTNLKPFTDFLDSQGVKFISQINPTLIRDFLLLLEERNHNAGGVHGFFRAIKVFMKWYWDETEQESVNPISKVKAPRVPVEPIQGISKEDFDALLNICPKMTFYGIRNASILMVLYDTGVRASEALSINSEDVNLADSSILIKQGKGRKPRTVFFGKKTRKQLRKLLNIKIESNALFTDKDGDRMKYTGLRELMRRLSVKANIPAPAIHGFRRAFTLNCLQAGMNETTISRLLGHSNTSLIGRYAKQNTVDLMSGYKSPIDAE